MVTLDRPRRLTAMLAATTALSFPLAAHAQSCGTTTGSLGQPCGPAQLDSKGTLTANTATAAWSAAQPRQLGTRAADVLNVKDFGAVGNGTHDDTAALQAAINAATAQNLGYRVVIPSGTYLITAPLTATITGTAGLDIEGAGSKEVMLLAQYPSSATNWDLFDIQLGLNGEYNGASRNSGGRGGQVLKMAGFTAIQNDAVGHPAGSMIYVLASQSSDTAVFADSEFSDLNALGGQQIGNDVNGQTGVNQATGNGINSGFDSWLNGIYLSGVSSASIANLGIQGPAEAGVAVANSIFGSCTSAGQEPGMTYIPPVTYNGTSYGPISSCMVAGAGVLIGSSTNYNLQTSGVSVTGGNVKGFVAAEAVGGVAQGFGMVGTNTFDDEYGLMLGGDQILDQLGGPPVTATISGTNTYGATAATQTFTLASSNSAIVPGMMVVGTYFPLGAVVKSISGTSVTVARQDGTAFPVGAKFTETASFTKGFVLSTPSGTGTFGASFACDDWAGCINAPIDQNTSLGFNNIQANGMNIISNDGSPNWIGYNVGRSFGHQFNGNDLQSNRGMNQRFLVAQLAFASPGLDAQDNIVSSGGSTAYQFDLQNFGSSVVANNHVTGTAPLGEDTTCGATWGTNFAAGSTQIGIANCSGALSFDAKQNLAVPGFVAGSVAGGGTAQSGATPLTAQTSLVACASGATAYLVPATAEIGDAVTIDNIGSNACLIYPQSGMQLAYDLSPNQAFTLPAGATQTFKLQNASSWIREERNLVVGSTTEQALKLTPALTVSSLPACNSASQGLVENVSDASNPTFLGTLAGGGSKLTLAQCNGTAWVAQ